ncbi:hypothetical protein NQZ79_g4517 [Umbelopsis isabellina]|nr:hypothetical protein NQZ79_g4517 [Umbelopsis isabellina]
MQHSSLLHLPDELLIQICSLLDVLSIFAIADSCSLGRNRLLSMRSIWRHIAFDPNQKDLHAIYATLRRFRDDNTLNHLRPLVESVYMDSFDDPMISPIVMLVKFPSLQHISATNRRYNTSIESDTKVLQSFLKQRKILPGSLSLQSYHVYNPYMNEDRLLSRFQSTLSLLAKSGSVQLDIKECSHALVSQPVANNLDNETTGEDDVHLQTYCHRIISKYAKCLFCGEPEVFCYKCVEKCSNCGVRRLPPFVNALNVLEATNVSNNAADGEDMFSVFE